MDLQAKAMDLQVKVYGLTGHTLWTSSSACAHHTGNGTMCTGKVSNAQSHAMQIERSIYDTASRAVEHQRNPDGSVKQDAVPAEPAAHDAASTSQPAGVIRLNCMDHRGHLTFGAFMLLKATACFECTHVHTVIIRMCTSSLISKDL